MMMMTRGKQALAVALVCRSSRAVAMFKSVQSAMDVVLASSRAWERTSLSWHLQGEGRSEEGPKMGALDPGHFLISCPECGAWSMAANVRSAWHTSLREVTFVCGPCGCQEAAAVSVSGQLLKITHLLPLFPVPQHC